MEDEKYDRALSGLSGSGSSYVCTLCHATKERAMTELGTFTITRTREEIDALADYHHQNPDNLSEAALRQVFKGSNITLIQTLFFKI